MLAADVRSKLLRIGREAVTNAARHARAHEVRMHLTYAPDAIVLRVSDDGHGFDPDQLVDQGSEHYGLVSMHERAQDIGGAVQITSGVDQGTCITAFGADPLDVLFVRSPPSRAATTSASCAWTITASSAKASR